MALAILNVMDVDPAVTTMAFDKAIGQVSEDKAYLFPFMNYDSSLCLSVTVGAIYL